MNADRTRHAGVRAAGALAALALTAGGSLAFAAAASAEDREVPLLNIEAEAAPATVEVMFPADGWTFHEPPRFSGFAQIGATITITVNGTVVGEEVVPSLGGDPVEGESGPWAIDVPEAQLPAEGTFDATVTQEFQGATESVTITGLSVDVFGALITSPLPDDEVDGDVIFSGQAFTEGTIALLLQGTTDAGDEVSAVAFSGEAPAAEIPGAEAADPVEWPGEFTVEQDGADGTVWTFDPAEAIEVGDYEVSTGVVVGEDVDLGNTVSFRVATPGTGDDTGSESGDDTGSDNGDETGSENGDETGGDESGDASGDESGDASGDEAGDDSGAESGSDEGAENGAESGAEDGAESGADNGAESGSDEGAESGSEDGAEDGAENGGGGDLPDTGPDTLPWAMAGLALLLGGAALVVIRAQRSAA